MASTEQPMKKRKLYEPPPLPPQPPPQPPPPPPPKEDDEPSVAPPPQTPPQLSQEEILRRRRNHEEIRSVYENYKTIKRCISGKDPRHMPELEQAYLSLISASRGCTSVQRILSEFIPRYASYCPTALEAAAQVVINMHNWSVPVISRGDDVDGVSFGTAKNCVVGLVDICRIASLEAPTSSVIRGICSAVFLNVATFFATSVEGKDIFQILDEESLKIQDSVEKFDCLKKMILEEDSSALHKLLKLRALCLLRIFFLCPKDLLGACFELFSTHAADGFSKAGKYFLHQLSGALDVDNESNLLNANGAGLLKSCLLGLVLGRDPCLKKWIFSRYHRLRKSASSEAASQVTTAFEGIFESFTAQVRDSIEDDDDDGSNSSKYVSRQDLVHRLSNQPSTLCEVSPKDPTLQLHGKSSKDELSNKVSDKYLKRHGSTVSLESDRHSNASSNHDSGGSKCMDFDSKEQENVSHGWLPMPKDVLCSPMSRKPSDMKIDSFEQGKNQAPNANISRFSSGLQNNIVWYSDGDPAAMDVFSASRQLWLGSLAPDASEASIRFELERFGHIENFLFFPVKGFSLVEYRNIIDAIKAREFMRRYSPWGYPIRIKFIDGGLGTRGAVNGVAIGSSCHVFIGNVLNQWMKDEIMREIMKAICRGPRMVTELTSEGALLLEFDAPEEATNAMVWIRQFRRGISSALGNMGNTFLGSPHGQTIGSPANRMHNAAAPFMMKPEGIPPEFASPRASFEKQGLTMRVGQVTQSNMAASGGTDMPGIGSSQGMWMYRKPELELQSAGPIATQGPTIAPPQPIQAPPYMQPVYPPPTSSWDARGFSHHVPLNTIPPNAMPSNIHTNPIPPPYIQTSVTPLSQIPGSGIQPYGQMVPQPMLPSHLPSMPPPQPDMPPPLPPSPPVVPPPPSSPPPPPPAVDPPPPTTEPSNMVGVRSNRQIEWQGTLSKSGVNYCTVYAHRLDSDFCKYSISISEPAGWPAKLDMTKRTDFNHVKATFTNTLPYRREVCQLVPSSAADHKGFQGFVSYLKQRECVGVIKIPATKFVWARLLFILPYSVEACSLLSIKPTASDCLIAVVLPKDTNLESA